ncbi:hypothetical protein [Limosilactobacillus reuteri]|uniref:hypothetical protein n=1 Tax=Limosilactobacillus reuteri TaxID=1598 RepID=UPI000A31FA6D|nr:hypothetical protein [Limosilactobacillus reuteri]
MAIKANKPIIFYINPPFGTANSRSFSHSRAEKKRDMAKTEVRALMQDAKMGKATQQLYAQFFYRIVDIVNIFHLDNVILASFSPYQFRVGGDYFGKFYNHFLQTLHPFKGFLFSAGEFSDVNSDWGITFSLYSNESIFPHNEKVNVCEFNQGAIQNLFTKEIRTVNKENSLNEWIKSNQKLNKDDKLLGADKDFTAVTSAIKPVKPNDRAVYYSDAIGYMYFIGNDVEHSDTAVSLFSTLFKSQHGIVINQSNLIPSLVSFAIRRSANFQWFNGKDAFYIDKDISNNLLSNRAFISDCLIFSLSQYRSSYQSSLGINSIPEGYPEIDNYWFYLPSSIMSKLYGNIKVSDETRTLFSQEFRRAKSSEDTPIVKLLNSFGVKFLLSDDSLIEIELSKESSLTNEATNMLNVMIELFNKTWKYRELAVKGHPEWSLERFDAGFNQMYRLMTQMIDDGD